MKGKSNIILFVVFFLIVLSFVTTQLTNDFFVFWAYGRFVSNSDASGIASLLDTWEMKGLLFKAYLFVEYALTALFSTSFDARCQIIYKLIGIIPFLSILGLSIYCLPNSFLSNRLSKIQVFLTSSILLLAVHFASHFQAEMWGVLLLILSFSIYLRDGWQTKILAAFIYAFTFYLKSPIPLMGGSLVVASLLIKKQTIKESFRDIFPFAITTTVFLGCTLCLIYVFYPQEITDIWRASYFQHTLFHDYNKILGSLLLFIKAFLLSFIYHPVIFIGFVTALVQIIRYKKEKTVKNAILLFLIWMFPAIYILLSNQFFVYHYYLFSFSSLLTTLILYNNQINLNKKIIWTTSPLFLVLYLVVLSSISPHNIHERYKYLETQSQISEEYGINVGSYLGNGSILYLDDGIGAFFFANKSYLRFFYPLPMQRIGEKDAFSTTQAYFDIKKKAIDYQGKYITLRKRWFLLNGRNNDVYEKIIKEYDLDKIIVYHSYSWNLFDLNSPNDTLLVYKRNKIGI